MSHNNSCNILNFLKTSHRLSRVQGKVTKMIGFTAAELENSILIPSFFEFFFCEDVSEYNDQRVSSSSQSQFR